MEKEGPTRKKLLEAYESLPPEDQVILQLCSLIDEPISRSVCYKIFRRARQGIPGSKIDSARLLDSHLARLMSFELLDATHQVAPEIVETITRRACAEGRIYKARDFLKDIDSKQAWTRPPAGHNLCIRCANAVQGKAFAAPLGPLCLACVESELKMLVDDERLEDWPEERILGALSSGGDLKSRLAVLYNLDSAHGTLYREGTRTYKEAEDLLYPLLVENMGFMGPHPLAATVRQAALRACDRLGSRVLPLLIKRVRKEPVGYYKNILTLLGGLGRDMPEIQALLQEASDHPDPAIRSQVVSIIGQEAVPWVVDTLKKLSEDPDQGVRAMAAVALGGSQAHVGRIPPVYRRGYTGFSENPSKSSIRFGPLVMAVRSELPMGTSGSVYGEKACKRIAREVRIGIYAEDEVYFRNRWRDLLAYCDDDGGHDDILVRICNDPFDPAWFAGLPEGVRMQALSTIFQHAMLYLKPDAEALTYTLKDPLFKAAPQVDRGRFLYNLVSRLILGGRLNDAQNIIPQIESSGFSNGLMGWLRFVEGKNEEAIASFEADLKEVRHRLGKRNINLSGYTGLFYILALVMAQDKDLLRRANQLFEWSFPADGGTDFRSSALMSLNGMILAQEHQVAKAKDLVSAESKADGIISVLFNAMASFWVTGKLSQDQIGRIDRMFRSSREVGMDWVAMESAALLTRAGGAASAHLDFLAEVVRRTGMQPLVSSIVVEEPWHKGLRALVEIGSEGEVPTARKRAAGARLIWLVSYGKGGLSLQPLEQRLSAKGEWSKGRPVAMSRLFRRDKVDFITQQDHAVCSAITREQIYYYGDNYSFDMNKLLPALVGHPLLFLETSPSVPVEFVRAEPELLVAKSGHRLRIKFAVEPTEDRIMLIQETPSRFKVVELTEKHRRMAQILGGEGLSVPASARQEVLDAISALSSHVIIHSDIGGRSRDVVEVASDPTPHVHLMPSGTGFRVEVFVKPFGKEGGPFLKPAAGAVNVIAEVGGRRMQTQRDLQREERMADALDAASPTLSRLAEGDRQWQFEDPEDCLQVLLELKTLQEKGEIAVEWPEGEKLRVTREVPIDRFRMKIRGKTDWFELSGGLAVDDSLVLDMKRLLDLLKTTPTRFIPLGDGQFLALTSEFRKRLDELAACVERKGKDIRLHPLAALTMQDLLNAIPHLDVDGAWKTRMEHIRAGQELNPPLPSTLRAALRDYQVEGYTWMARLAHMGIGACLADDMGLGKTVQALALLLSRATQGPSLVVAPTSVCWNWVAEARRFAPTLNVLRFDGSGREKRVQGLQAQDVLVTSYGLLVQEAELLSGPDWNVIVLDEAQAIKNPVTRRSQAAMGLKGKFRMITTGTPIENHLGELWTLFNFINPGLLGTIERFNERFAVPIEKYRNRDAGRRLKRLIQPFLLRRLKSQVLEELPPRTEVVLHVEMSVEETAFYEALRQQALARIEADEGPSPQKHLKILAEITKLRQAACNPRLIAPDSPLTSSKLELFEEVVAELLENRHKALVFSQFVGHLSLIRDLLDRRRIHYRYIDGSTPPKERQREVEAFQSGEGDLFLISLKAGGLGLNLTAADYVIHMDPWWNPAVEDQASDRAHRIGQRYPVTVYRLVAKGTIEEKILNLHGEKRDLAGTLLDGSDITGKISAEDLIRLIREE